MDKFTSIAKGGWHPSGDKPIRKESWKSDLKGMATGKKKDPYESARNHQSAPLSSLKDPDSFGPPPKHYPSGQPPPPPNALTAPKPQAVPTYQGPTGGLGSVVPSPRRREEQEAEEAKPKPPPIPYRADTSGLRTDHLPKPPVRKADDSASPASATTPRAAVPAPARSTPTLPARGGPPPILPPRQNEFPDEHTPAPPPPYAEASKQPASLINQAATSRLGQAGISVPGFNIGSQANNSNAPPIPAPTGPQLSELQQRFARMSTGSNSQATSSLASSAGSAISAAAGKKAPPPPPKKNGLGQQMTASPDAPPPLPLSSKPRPS